MRKYVMIVSLQSFVAVAYAQPYVDIFQVRYTYAFRSPNDQSKGTPFMHFWAGSDLPIKIKDKTYLLLSPYVESWRIDSAATENVVPSVKGLVLPVGVLFPLNEKWSWMISGIVRTNGEELFGPNTLQAGGVTFFSYQRSTGKKIRFGVYVNSDFFGLFVIPLLGADWKANERDHFFGLLPGRFTWEHKFNKSLYGGATFRAITNSYRLKNNEYLRIDDNQLSVFLDIYAAKKVCFTLEPGYGILRQLRTGKDKRKYTSGDNWGDGFFIKLSAAYRLRL
jgi:hypothetical protein